jgi:hypothetical protein
MNYAVVVALDRMIHIPSIVKIDSGVQQFFWVGEIHVETQTVR